MKSTKRPACPSLYRKYTGTKPRRNKKRKVAEKTYPTKKRPSRIQGRIFTMDWFLLEIVLAQHRREWIKKSFNLLEEKENYRRQTYFFHSILPTIDYEEQPSITFQLFSIGHHEISCHRRANPVHTWNGKEGYPKTPRSWTVNQQVLQAPFAA